MPEEVITAEDYIKQHPYVDSFLSSAQGYEVLTTFMKKFAELHTQAALRTAVYKAKLQYDEFGKMYFVDRKSILDSYPLENIK